MLALQKECKISSWLTILNFTGFSHAIHFAVLFIALKETQSITHRLSYSATKLPSRRNACELKYRHGYGALDVTMNLLTDRENHFNEDYETNALQSMMMIPS